MGGQTITLENSAIHVAVRIRHGGQAALEHVLPAGVSPRPSCSPYFDDSSIALVELRLSGEGNVNKIAKAMIGSYVGERLKYRSHRIHIDNLSKTLDIELYDEKTKVTATSHLTIFEKVPVLRARVTVRNDSDASIVVTQMPSIVAGGLTRSREWWHDYEVSYANNTWFREAQWVTRSLPDVGLDDFRIYGHQDPHDCSLATFGLSNRGTFSTQKHLAMGMLQRRDQTETWLWQIESSGSWRWEIGDFRDNIYLAVSGPTSDDHEWRQPLEPGASFTSVPAALGHVYGGVDVAFGTLTDYRRRIRRPHADYQALPIIFNDYMNCLMGDPTDEKILALVEPAAKSGAEYFVIDSGWYADDGNWWDEVGLWEPSKKRFPMGFQKLLGRIQEAGMRPGLWLEPEVIGVRSVMADRLPREAFFQRDGHRVTERGRYQLDYRHPEVIKWLDSVVDRCVKEYGVCYFKFDYNIEVTQGTDVNCPSPGVGQLEHNRAYLAWVSRIIDRYPNLVIENCSSGAQRMDYAMLAIHTLQSTSDQQHPHLYAPIAASAPTAVTPEQGATWVYPQSDWSDETNVITVINSLLGRIHLSGRLDTMGHAQLELIREGMKVYQDIRIDINNAVPFWPLGLPSWHDDWIALGLLARSSDENNARRCYLTVWRRGGSTKCNLPMAPLGAQKGVQVKLLYPKTFPVQSAWDESAAILQVEFPNEVSARVFQLQI